MSILRLQILSEKRSQHNTKMWKYFIFPGSFTSRQTEKQIVLCGIPPGIFQENPHSSGLPQQQQRLMLPAMSFLCSAWCDSVFASAHCQCDSVTHYLYFVPVSPVGGVVWWWWWESTGRVFSYLLLCWTEWTLLDSFVFRQNVFFFKLVSNFKQIIL